jgi:hypothetical protein
MGRNGIPYDINGIKNGAMFADLRSRGVIPSCVESATNESMRPALRAILGGDQSIPAILNASTAEEANAVLDEHLMGHAQVHDDGLHDFKGLFKVLVALIYVYSDVKTREGIVEARRELGLGKRSSKGCDTRLEAAAYELIYANCKPNYLRIVKLMSQLSACGMYLPPEDRAAKHIVLYIPSLQQSSRCWWRRSLAMLQTEAASTRALVRLGPLRSQQVGFSVGIGRL